MTGSIRHIGKKDSGDKGFRYKRLVNSGIFRNRDTRDKLIDCRGEFETWTNEPAKDWINARVKELHEGRNINISCDCCDTTNPETVQQIKDGTTEGFFKPEYDERCCGQEIVNLIIRLEKEKAEE